MRRRIHIIMLNEDVMKAYQSPVDDCAVYSCGVEVSELRTKKHASLSLSGAYLNTR